jgi:hypothetical protein
LAAAGFAVAGFAAAAFAAAVLAGVDRLRVVVDRLLVVVDRRVVARPAGLTAAGLVAAVGAPPAAAAGADAEPGAVDEAAGLLRDAPGFAAERDLFDRAVDRRAVDRGAARVWRPRIPSMRARSSAISSRTSARRAVRLARLFFVAFSSRPARQVSSERAAASANSSHSMWRASAASGVITAVVVSVMSSPQRNPSSILVHDGVRRERPRQLAAR